jgi:hypothetical protein
MVELTLETLIDLHNRNHIQRSKNPKMHHFKIFENENFSVSHLGCAIAGLTCFPGPSSRLPLHMLSRIENLISNKLNLKIDDSLLIPRSHEFGEHSC